MIIEEQGITLDFKMPQTMNDPIVVKQCPTGKAPERVGTIVHLRDERTDEVTYYAIGKDGSHLCEPTCDWQKVELEFLKYTREQNRNLAERVLIEMNDRMKELTAIRRSKGQVISKGLNYSR